MSTTATPFLILQRIFSLIFISYLLSVSLSLISLILARSFATTPLPKKVWFGKRNKLSMATAFAANLARFEELEAYANSDRLLPGSVPRSNASRSRGGRCCCAIWLACMCGVILLAVLVASGFLSLVNCDVRNPQGSGVLVRRQADAVLYSSYVYLDI